MNLAQNCSTNSGKHVFITYEHVGTMPNFEHGLVSYTSHGTPARAHARPEAAEQLLWTFHACDPLATATGHVTGSLVEVHASPCPEHGLAWTRRLPSRLCGSSMHVRY